MERITDVLGRTVPRRLESIFAGRAKLLKWADQLDRLRQELARMSQEPYCRDVDLRGVYDLLETARVKVLHGSPHVPCNCPNQFTDCPYCAGSHWTSITRCLTAKPLPDSSES
jgi:hypothetical protein